MMTSCLSITGHLPVRRQEARSLLSIAEPSSRRHDSLTASRVRAMYADSGHHPRCGLHILVRAKGGRAHTRIPSIGLGLTVSTAL